MNWRITLTFCAVLMAASTLVGAAQFIDPLDQPAALTELSTKYDMVDVVNTGGRLVVVGARGQILLSEDQGKTWRQVSVPVSTDLTSVYFPVKQSGWAVGHDGVVLHSNDGGETWIKQLDGRAISKLMATFYQAKKEAGENVDTTILDEANLLADGAPAFPLLAVWFRNEREGFVVGAFNLILHTANGGDTWEPWIERTDNPRRYHLYSITGNGANVYIAGELGLLLHLDEQQQRFTALPSPYNGSFFGVVADERKVVAFGLRGNAYESSDSGQHWQKLENTSESSLVGGVMLANALPLLVDIEGRLYQKSTSGLQLELVTKLNPFATQSIATVSDNRGVTLVGPYGSKVVPIN